PTTPATPPARQQRSPPTATRSAQANPYPLPPPRPIQPRQPVACSSGGPPSLILVGSARHAPNQSGRAGGPPHKLLQPPGQRPPAPSGDKHPPHAYVPMVGGSRVVSGLVHGGVRCQGRSRPCG